MALQNGASKSLPRTIKVTTQDTGLKILVDKSNEADTIEYAHLTCTFRMLSAVLIVQVLSQYTVEAHTLITHGADFAKPD